MPVLVVGLAFYWQFFSNAIVADTLAPALGSFGLTLSGLVAVYNLLVLLCAGMVVALVVRAERVPLAEGGRAGERASRTEGVRTGRHGACLVATSAIAAVLTVLHLCLTSLTPEAAAGGEMADAGQEASVLAMVTGAACLAAYAASFALSTAAWARACSLFGRIQRRSGSTAVAIVVSSLLCLLVTYLASTFLDAGALMVCTPVASAACLLAFDLTFVRSAHGTVAEDDEVGSDRRPARRRDRRLCVLSAALLFAAIFVRTACSEMIAGDYAEGLTLTDYLTLLCLCGLLIGSLAPLDMGGMAARGVLVLSVMLGVGIACIVVAGAGDAGRMGMRLAVVATSCLEIVAFFVASLEGPRRAGAMALATIVISEMLASLYALALTGIVGGAANEPFVKGMSAASAFACLACVVVLARMVAAEGRLRDDRAGRAGQGCGLGEGGGTDGGTLGHAGDSGNVGDNVGIGGDGKRSARLPIPSGFVDASVEKSLDEIASAHGLTARERQMLSYVFRGYSARHTAEMEGVSLSTVQTHTRNAYRKLDIHSRQELMDLTVGRERTDEHE